MSWALITFKIVVVATVSFSMVPHGLANLDEGFEGYEERLTLN